MFEIVTASLVVCPRLALIRDFLELEGLPFDLRCDQRFVMLTTRGLAHPATGFVVLTKDGVVLNDMYDVVHYVEEQGLKRC